MWMPANRDVSQQNPHSAAQPLWSFEKLLKPLSVGSSRKEVVGRQFEVAGLQSTGTNSKSVTDFVANRTFLHLFLTNFFSRSFGYALLIIRRLISRLDLSYWLNNQRSWQMVSKRMVWKRLWNASKESAILFQTNRMLSFGTIFTNKPLQCQRNPPTIWSV